MKEYKRLSRHDFKHSKNRRAIRKISKRNTIPSMSWDFFIAYEKFLPFFTAFLCSSGYNGGIGSTD